MKNSFFRILLAASLLCSVSIYAEEKYPLITLDTNCGSYFYQDGNAIREAPALGFKLDPGLSLTPLYTYAKKWGNLILYNHTNNKLQEAYPLASASEEIRKNIPDNYFSEKYHYIDYAVQGADIFLPANKGEIFRISVVDTKSKKERLSFDWSCSTSDPGFAFSDLEWIDDRYLLQVWPCRKWTFLKIIDLKKKTVIDGNFGDPKQILSAAVIGGKVMIIRDGDGNGAHSYESPLEH